MSRLHNPQVAELGLKLSDCKPLPSFQNCCLLWFGPSGLGQKVAVGRGLCVVVLPLLRRRTAKYSVTLGGMEGEVSEKELAGDKY